MRGMLLLSVALVMLISNAASPVSAESFEQSVASGKTVYARNCASCHGAKGEGGIGPALNSKDKLDSLGIENIRLTVEEGKEGTPVAMPKWKGVLTDQQIEDVVHFIFNEWAGLVIVGIEMWPWEVAFVVFGAIWMLMGIYYIIKP